MILCFLCAGRIVAITRDCKSCVFGLRGFESLPAHKIIKHLFKKVFYYFVAEQARVLACVEGLEKP